ncbi:hypothetical protein F383_08766 [Gossypium arboreum]|uniref:Uncharacterized protein n=1 Tax=Gossypium arboreum TaxID=29729 RepID=A0A0B0PQZ4_GOSAR|nr:hypothetical protein F383_08766 [Gossypium arboreum]
MSLRLPIWLSSYICCGLTTARMSILYFSSIELTVHQLRRSLLIMAQKSGNDNELTEY